VKVFISWSGERSKELAIALKGWIPLILQYAQPWVSEKDISAGDRWAQAISGELESSNFGILCITPENIRSEWILFEAGALSKSMLDAKVIPLLFGLELSDLSGPLSQFQALKVDQQGVMDVVKAINNVSEIKASEATINQLVPALWGQLQQKIESIPGKIPVGKHMRPHGEILEDLVSQVRGLGSRMRDMDPDLSDRDGLIQNRGRRDLNVRMVREMVFDAVNSHDGEFLLLILAGFFRDSMPWLSEVLVEAHRDLKRTGLKESVEIRDRLMRLVEQSMHFGQRSMERDKASQMLMMELPMLVDRAVSFHLERRTKLRAAASDKSISEEKSTPSPKTTAV
jgi:TIR domain